MPPRRLTVFKEGITAGPGEVSPLNGYPVGRTVTRSVSPVADTNVYASGDLIGGKLVLPDVVRAPGGGAVIQSLSLVDEAKQSLAIDVVFFLANPWRTPFTDQAALDIDDSDLQGGVRVVSILATDYAAFNDNSLATKYGLGLGFQLAAGRDLYVCLVARSAPTYAAATDLKLSVDVLQD